VRKLYVLPKDWETRDMLEAMEWATSEVLRLDEENQRLREQLADYERGTVPARTIGAQEGTA
jgi:hypothetical protein